MQLAFSTNAFTRHSLADALAQIAVAGFKSVEILADVPHAYPATLGDEQIDAIVRDLSRHGLSVSNINANCAFGYWRDAPPEPYFEPSIISPNAVHRADRLNLIRGAMRLGKAVGARNISITSGRLLAGMPPDLAQKQFAESMKTVLDMADQFAIDVGIECEPGLYVEYVAELRQWIDRLNHPRLGANLDIGHCQVIGESIPDAVALLSDRIWNMHVEDIPGRKHYHMIPGTGTLDWSALKSALQSIRYNRALTVELYTHTANAPEAALRSFAFLSQWWK